MTESRDEWIKKRAYAIWEEEGYPSGRDTAHWEQALAERAAIDKVASNGEEAKPKTTRRKPTAPALGNGAAPAKAAPKRTATRKTETVKA